MDILRSLQQVLHPPRWNPARLRPRHVYVPFSEVLHESTSMDSNGIYRAGAIAGRALQCHGDRSQVSWMSNTMTSDSEQDAKYQGKRKCTTYGSDIHARCRLVHWALASNSGTASTRKLAQKFWQFPWQTVILADLLSDQTWTLHCWPS